MKLIDFLRVFDDSHEVIELWQDNEDTNPRKENKCLYNGLSINEKYEPGVAADHILMGKWFDCEVTSMNLENDYITPMITIFIKVPQDLQVL
ncbi:hypothetical protein LaP1706_gp42 [Lactococcus phage 1706]|uniref:Uncharacterized protein n=1 Tax=Lactococcus phage 1706 TaxID=475178 RepID=B2BTK6_9CAUD|nr:hypothetical protein LaP1706_gp42 [Lactococcus phage 1706]ABV91249.1 unknown [Lactococcus phage 1706]